MAADRAETLRRARALMVSCSPRPGQSLAESLRPEDFQPFPNLRRPPSLWLEPEPEPGPGPGPELEPGPGPQRKRQPEPEPVPEPEPEQRPQRQRHRRRQPEPAQHPQPEPEPEPKPRLNPADSTESDSSESDAEGKADGDSPGHHSLVSAVSREDFAVHNMVAKLEEVLEATREQVRQARAECAAVTKERDEARARLKASKHKSAQLRKVLEGIEQRSAEMVDGFQQELAAGRRAQAQDRAALLRSREENEQLQASLAELRVEHTEAVARLVWHISLRGVSRDTMFGTAERGPESTTLPHPSVRPVPGHASPDGNASGKNAADDAAHPDDRRGAEAGGPERAGTATEGEAQIGSRIPRAQGAGAGGEPAGPTGPALTAEERSISLHSLRPWEPLLERLDSAIVHSEEALADSEVRHAEALTHERAHDAVAAREG
eukprot:COSAG04_NODE_682_length_11188_cov_2.885021_5_plen_435_part_00